MSNLQASRYELKFLISEAKAKAIRQEVVARMKPDAFTKDESGYHIRSLYLDSRHLACYQQTSDGVKNRFKLRVRFYDDANDAPVFLEVKRRVTNVIQKKRACVSKESASKLVRGGAPTPDMLLQNNSQQRDALVTFCRLRDQLAAVGHIYVDYYREAFECDSNNQYRVTFDRDVCGSPHVPGSGIAMPPRKKMSRIDGVVLELKFVNKQAHWMTQLTQRFGLQSISVPKYVECVDVLSSNSPITTFGAHA